MIKLCIWGIGKCGSICFHTLKKEVCEVVNIVDSDKSKQGSRWNGFCVKAPEDMLLESNNYDYILIYYITFY